MKNHCTDFYYLAVTKRKEFETMDYKKNKRLVSTMWIALRKMFCL